MTEPYQIQMREDDDTEVVRRQGYFEKTICDALRDKKSVKMILSSSAPAEQCPTRRAEGHGETAQEEGKAE